MPTALGVWRAPCSPLQSRSVAIEAIRGVALTLNGRSGELSRCYRHGERDTLVTPLGYASMLNGRKATDEPS